jgi:hypothetical protein
VRHSFVAGQGLETSGNVVIGNRLTGNGLPGVAFHLHTASTGQNVNDNVIVGNYIAGNGADTEDAATPGPTGINVFGVAPITGTVIAGNVIKDEQVDIAVSTASPAVVDVHLNDLLGQQIGLDNLGSGGVEAGHRPLTRQEAPSSELAQQRHNIIPNEQGQRRQAECAAEGLYPPSVLGDPHLHPNPFSSKPRTSPIGLLITSTVDAIPTL